MSGYEFSGSGIGFNVQNPTVETAVNDEMVEENRTAMRDAQEAEWQRYQSDVLPIVRGTALETLSHLYDVPAFSWRCYPGCLTGIWGFRLLESDSDGVVSERTLLVSAHTAALRMPQGISD